MDRTDLEDLLARIGMGDSAAFDRLYDATSGKLFGMCLRVSNNRSTAEDALQEAYVKIWTHAGRYRPGPHSPMAWLMTIARNAAIDKLRAGKVSQGATELDMSLASPDPDPERHAIAGSDTERLLECFDTLPEDRAEAIKAAYLRGASYAELAQRFNQPINTMRTWLRRGLIALRECMSDD